MKLKLLFSRPDTFTTNPEHAIAHKFSEILALREVQYRQLKFDIEAQVAELNPFELEGLDKTFNEMYGDEPAYFDTLSENPIDDREIGLHILKQFDEAIRSLLDKPREELLPFLQSMYEIAETHLPDIDILVIPPTGSGAIPAFFYGQESEFDFLSKEQAFQFLFEAMLIKVAADQEIPTYATCHGAQMTWLLGGGYLESFSSKEPLSYPLNFEFYEKNWHFHRPDIEIELGGMRQQDEDRLLVDGKQLLATDYQIIMRDCRSGKFPYLLMGDKGLQVDHACEYPYVSSGYFEEDGRFARVPPSSCGADDFRVQYKILKKEFAHSIYLSPGDLSENFTSLTNHPLLAALDETSINGEFILNERQCESGKELCIDGNRYERDGAYRIIDAFRYKSIYGFQYHPHVHAHCFENSPNTQILLNIIDAALKKRETAGCSKWEASTVDSCYLVSKSTCFFSSITEAASAEVTDSSFSLC